jgi:hypothetical protein
MDMRNPVFSVSAVTIFLLVYVTLINTGDHYSWALLMFVLSPFLVVWMVYTVLKYGKPSGKKFTDDFYDDVNYKRLPDND